MTVLTILGVLAGAFALLVLVARINNYSYRKYKYDIFNWGNFSVSAIGYVAIFFGNNWFHQELAHHGDILNGQLLVLIGLLFIAGVVYSNIKKSSFIFGIIISILQQIVYAPLSVVALFGVIVVIAALFETRPVYRIN